jgi:predicted ribosome quality control (RQC) complex YloA/Tae2 family protein
MRESVSERLCEYRRRREKKKKKKRKKKKMKKKKFEQVVSSQGAHKQLCGKHVEF